jgi:hypothetical protein
MKMNKLRLFGKVIDLFIIIEENLLIMMRVPNMRGEDISMYLFLFHL